MTNMEACCNTMDRALRDENITTVALGGDRVGFWIYGRPEFGNDGEEHRDVSISELQIQFCPFCGKELR